MKSRIAGSAVQALRSAALGNSGGTAPFKNCWISLSATMDSMGGKLAGSKAVGEGVSAGGIAVSASRFNLSQREKKLSGSLMHGPSNRRRDGRAAPTWNARA